MCATICCTLRARRSVRIADARRSARCPVVGVNPDDATALPSDNANMPHLRVLVVDDHEGFRAVARDLLERDGLLVVAEVGDGVAALEAASSVVPDLVLLDVHLPDLDGFEVSKRLAALPSPPTVVLTSSRPITDLRRRIAESPAAGFVPKDRLSGAALLELA